MKPLGYAAFTANAFQTRLAYRNQVWSSALGELVGVLARIAIWTSVYAGVSSVDGITLADMITYSLLASTVTAFNYSPLLNDVGQAVKSGDVAVYLLKPLHYPLYLLSSQCGNLAFELIAIVAPVCLIIAVFFGILPPASLFHGVFFLVFWCMSFLTIFALATLCGLLAFWLMTAQSIEWFLTGILSLFSGWLVPLWFFPPVLAAIAGYLPFAWINYYPAAVYLGKLDVAATLLHCGIGLAWLAVLALAIAQLWSCARHRIVVQGG